MKTSIQWLGDFLPAKTPLKGAAAGEALTYAGLPVESIETHNGDTILDVEVTSNRSDCLSHIGVARELSALLNLSFKTQPVSVPESDEPASSAVSVRIDTPQLCPHYTARIIRGVKIGPSPRWLAGRLEAIGVRPINNVVDVTNYVMFEMGQPLHAFDFSRVGGRQIIVRAAARGESIVSIDGHKRQLTPGMLVIADSSQPIALAGVMGGLESEVTGQTTDILLESARFDPLSIRSTARALAMKSDSSYRYERGIDSTLPLRASLRAAQLILETAGGKLLKGVVAAGAENYQRVNLTLRLPRLKQILGVELPATEIVAAFNRLGLSPVQHTDRIDVTVPSHRLDITQEIDLVEEAARVLGYDRIPTRQEISIRLTPPDPDSITLDAICQTLVAAGYFEAITFSFISDELRSDFGSSMLRADASVRKADSSLRPCLIPGLLQALRFNETNGTFDAQLFEIGSVFAAAGGQIDEQRKIALIRPGEVRDARGAVEAILNRLDARRPVRVEPADHPGFTKGAAGKVLWDDQPVGFVGMIDRAITDRLSIRQSVVAAELEMAPLLAGNQHVPQLRALPRFPAVRRDLSLIVPENLRFEKIKSLIGGLKLPSLESVEFVTTYRGKPLEAGQKSVTITLVFRSPTTTLTSEHVESSVQRAISAAQTELGATLRA